MFSVFLCGVLVQVCVVHRHHLIVHREHLVQHHGGMIQNEQALGFEQHPHSVYSLSMYIYIYVYIQTQYMYISNIFTINSHIRTCCTKKKDSVLNSTLTKSGPGRTCAGNHSRIFTWQRLRGKNGPPGDQTSLAGKSLIYIYKMLGHPL